MFFIDECCTSLKLRFLQRLAKKHSGIELDLFDAMNGVDATYDVTCVLCKLKTESRILWRTCGNMQVMTLLLCALILLSTAVLPTAQVPLSP